jgi:hypothetical protein
VNDEYVVWLLVAALVVVAALVWFLYGRLPRQEDDVSADELAAEATWISDALAEAGTGVDPDAVEHVLRLHRRYLAGVVPPREPGDPGWPVPDVVPVPAPDLGADDPPVEHDGPRSEAPEADVRQPG